MKKILVVGANGLVGSHFTTQFQKKYAITAINKSSPENLKQEPIDTLVFLAQSKEYTSKTFTDDLFNTNVALVRHYLQKFAGQCKNVILFSTGSVYQETQAAINESSPLIEHNPSPYVASKLMAEMIAKTYLPFYESIAIVRPFAIYGKGLKPTMLFSRLLNSFTHQTPIEVGQNGGIAFNPVHANDAASFIDYLIEKNRTGVEYFNLFGPAVVTLMDVVKQAEKILDLPANISVREWAFKKSIAATQTHDFVSSVDLATGLSHMINSLQEA